MRTVKPPKNPKTFFIFERKRTKELSRLILLLSGLVLQILGQPQLDNSIFLLLRAGELREWKRLRLKEIQ